MAQDLQNDDLQDLIKSNNKVVSIYTLSWCDDCTAMKEEFNKLESEFSDVTFVIVDGEKNPNSLALAHIEVFPTVAFFEGGNNKAQTRTKKPDVLKEFIQENN